MSPLTKSHLLFLLNCIDALLTLLWVRFGVATEGNALMAFLLDMGNAPFLLTKVGIGAFAAYVLYYWFYKPVARCGMTLTLGIYISLMIAHVATGIFALTGQALR